MKTVVVIGSNSFSGSDFVDLLLQERDYRVVGVSRSPEKTALFLPYKRRADLSRFTFHQLNLNRDFETLRELLTLLQPAYIINFAAQSEVGPSWEHPEHWFQTNGVARCRLGEFPEGCALVGAVRPYFIAGSVRHLRGGRQRRRTNEPEHALCGVQGGGRPDAFQRR